MIELTQEEIDRYLQKWWSHMPAEVHAQVSKDIWARHDGYQASGQPLNAYVAAWVHKRGSTQELRIPEDISMAFFKTIVDQGDLKTSRESISIVNTGNGTKNLERGVIDGDNVELKFKEDGDGGPNVWLIVGIILGLLALGALAGGLVYHKQQA